jgi:hypothetical protein
MNNNYNNLYGDYIGATGIYSISDYIDNTSNILEINSSNYTNITSNILKLYTDTNITNLDNKYNKLIKQETSGLLTDVYITNSNILGEIRFITRFDLNNYKFKTKIKENGELAVYYAAYNPIYPTVFEGWYGVMDAIRDAYNFQNIATTATGGAYTAINDLYTKYFGLVAATGATIQAITGAEMTKEQFANIVIRASKEVKYSKFNKIKTLLGLSTGAIALTAIAFVSGVASSIAYDNTVTNVLNDISDLDLDVYSNITQTERDDATSNLIQDATSNLVELNDYLSNLSILQGFINSNIQTIQSIPYILSSNLYASNLSSLNISTSNLYASNLSSLNISTSNLYANNLSSLNISTSNLSSFNLYTSNLYVNSANINGIDINNLKTSGNIIENGSILSSKYLTSNHIYNMTQTYTTERQYPPKLYNNKQLEDNKELIGQLRYHTNLYLNDESIVYGSGYYEIYSSSTYELSTSSKDYLFNYNTNDTTPRARWGAYQYSSISGEYIGNDNINGYYGDWVIIKLPTEISLSRYRIYQFTDTPTKAPSLWKVFGSIDGIAFTEITTASQTTRLSSYTNSYHERIIPGTTPLYSYIGFIFNSLLSTSGQTELSFAELQLFGKEVIINAITSQIYTTSNVVKGIVEFEMPIVAKHYGFYITINTPININGTTYYKYDIDLRKYTQLGIIQIGPQTGDTFRSFKIRVMYATMFFSYIIKDLPNVCYYEVFMSYKNTAIPPNFVAGLNACAIGYPPNTTLQTIMPNNLFVVKNGMGSIDYITVISTNAADCRVIIEDMIG